MLLRTKGALVLAAVCALSFASATAQAAIINWDIDASKSSLKLSIPDTKVNLDGTSLTVRIRNQSGSSNTWTVGATAAMDGFLNTNYSDGSSIQFNAAGMGDVVGVVSGNYRPNPAAFNAANTNAENPDGQFQNTSSAPAVFGARARASVSILTLDAGYLDFRDVNYSAFSGSLGLTGDPNTTQNFTTAGALNFGVLSALIDLDGLSITLVGQPIPDTLGTELEDAYALNAGAAASIVNTGGNNRQMTIPVLLPISYDLGGGIVLTLNISGQIVANAVVPEPSTFMMAGLGLVSLGVVARRRFRRR